MPAGGCFQPLRLGMIEYCISDAVPRADKRGASRRASEIPRVPEDASVTTSGRVKLAVGLYQWCAEVGRGYEWAVVPFARSVNTS